jgi:hypothetical protein
VWCLQVRPQPFLLASWHWQGISRVGLSVGLDVGVGIGDDVGAYGVFDWVDWSGVLLIVGLIGALGLVWFWPHDRE